MDNVILCAGQEPQRELQAALLEAGMRVHLIGGADVAAELDAKRAIKQGIELAAEHREGRLHPCPARRAVPEPPPSGAGIPLPQFDTLRIGARRPGRAGDAEPPRQGQCDEPADVAGHPRRDAVGGPHARGARGGAARRRRQLLRRHRPADDDGHPAHGEGRLRGAHAREPAQPDPRPAGHAHQPGALPQAGARRHPRRLRRRRGGPDRLRRHALLRSG